MPKVCLFLQKKNHSNIKSSSARTACKYLPQKLVQYRTSNAGRPLQRKLTSKNAQSKGDSEHFSESCRTKASSMVGDTERACCAQLPPMQALQRSGRYRTVPEWQFRTVCRRYVQRMVS
ncbi:unnamed protein product [Acanthoscelides obtectus]|uniref:Uncharacterized protein n=1 Tax=Acanthoscelides obtectus TaxID=200917 RepID=A0A9P0JUB7_ACAOB|nr:unnamed protein product [Acanthoscelides obtectus]CAK1637438.1 hypothetical protein AOBTE_LOCUS9973 [Acanthoscelides obtectus]